MIITYYNITFSKVLPIYMYLKGIALHSYLSSVNYPSCPPVFCCAHEIDSSNQEPLTGVLQNPDNLPESGEIKGSMAKLKICPL